jgi:large subunit ribosomal protein L18
MSFKVDKEYRRLKIKRRVRKTITGSGERPRMTVFRSNKDIYVQLVDDQSGTTLAAASSRAIGIADKKVTKSEKAKLVGKLIAERALEGGILTVVFDRKSPG